MATPIWKQAGFSSQAAYEAELARKRAAGIALTRPDLAAEYDRQRQGNLLTGAQLLALNQQSAGGAAKAPVTAQAPVTVQPPYQSPVDTYKPGTFKAPSYTPLSFNAALGQAQSQLAPLYDQARTQQGITAEQQRALLRQQMGARGQLRGGLLNEGNIDISAGLLRSLADIDTGYHAQTAGMAQSLVAQDQARADAMRQQAYQEWLAGEQMRAQAAGQSAEEYWRNVAQQNWERDFTAGQDWQQRQFDYQVSRDQVLDNQWLQQFTAQEQQRAIENAYTNRQINLQERNALLSRSGGSGSAIAPAAVDLSDKKYTPYINEIKRMRAATRSDGFDTIPMYTQGQIIQYILNLGFSDEETAALLNYIGATSMPTISTGGKSYVNVRTR